MNVARRMRGFSLVEVLVSLVIIAVGLLGIAKIQTIAYAETGTSSLRSIAAIEASSMAASMRANRAYWAIGGSVTPALIVTVAGTAITSTTDAAMTGTPDCAVPGSPCTKEAMATYDVQKWARALNDVLPAGAVYGATINCPTTPTPINCTITITWTERVAGTAGGAASTVAVGAAIVMPNYTLNVQP
jgi:type IV pilus assembly protein PilV